MGNAIAGYGGTAKISTTAILNVKQWEIPFAADLYDVSVLGVQWKQYIPGLLGADAKVDVFTDLTDTTGQVAIQTAFFNGTSLSLSLLTSTAGGATAHTYSGTAYVKSIDSKVVVNGAEETSLTLTFTGAVTYA